MPPRRPPRPPGAAPTQPALHEAALSHLARFAATEEGLRRVLERRVDRWALRARDAARTAGDDPEATERIAAAAAASRATVAGVVARLQAAGVLDDRAFAESRGRSLGRAGRSRRASLAHLQSKGVGPELAREAVPEDAEAELAAAVAQARRRRVGPFAAPAEDDAADAARERGRRALAALARAGFTTEVARRALALDRPAAEALLLSRRRLG